MAKLSVPYQNPGGPGSPRGLNRVASRAVASRARLARAPARAGAFAAAASPSTNAAAPATVSQPREPQARAHLFIRMPPVLLRRSYLGITPDAVTTLNVPCWRTARSARH